MEILKTPQKAILIIGPAGSGKSTQARMIAEKFGFYYFRTSSAAKEYIASHGDSKTKEQKLIYDKGKLLDAKWMFSIVKQKTEEIFLKKGIKGTVYEGSPRTLYEAKKLYELLNKLIGKENIIILEIEISEKELKERLVKRLICSKDISHVFIEGKFKTGSVCPYKDGGTLNKRDLDDPKIFKTRMREYKTKTVPGFNFLKTRGNVVIINGSESQEKVFKNILNKIGLFLK